MFVLDDVFSSLDTNTAKAIFANLFGPRGVLKRSASTAILATHSVENLDAADVTIILDGHGNVTSRRGLVASQLSRQFVDRLSSTRAATTTEAAVSGPVQLREGFAGSEDENSLAIRKGGDMTLYKYFFSGTSRTMLLICLFALFILCVAEAAPGTSGFTLSLLLTMLMRP